MGRERILERNKVPLKPRTLNPESLTLNRKPSSRNPGRFSQVERILERKRVEDAAIRKREQTKKQLARYVYT
jgi:hypothetical protein